MRIRNFVLVAAAGCLLAGTATAESEIEESAGVRETSGYGPAGCGLGSMIFSPDSGFTQIFAATTNGSSGNQTFGISSGTSNCDDSDGGEESAKAFVETNRIALAKDIARGKGETIASLSELAGCQDSAAVGKALQRNFKTIFPSAKASNTQVSGAVLRTLKSKQALGCGNLS